MKVLVGKWELSGIVVISIAGTLLHFAFNWSGQSPIVGLIAAVNESVWEHFKIGVWPALFYAVLEYPFLRKATNNFVLARCAGTYAIPATIAVLFYSYTAAVGQHILAADILLFLIAIAAGQCLSYFILTRRPLASWLNSVGLVFLIVLAVAFCVFTFYPPELSIFRDPITGTYGIR